MGKIKVLIVEDSFFFTGVLKSRLSKCPNIEIVGNSLDGKNIVDLIKQLNPDVITLDVTLPEVSGLELLKYIMADSPKPVIIVSGLDLTVFDALSAGAVDFVKKPEMGKAVGLDCFIADVSEKIGVAALTRVKQRPIIGDKPAITTKAVPDNTQRPVVTPPVRLTGLKSNKIIIIGASTGGVEAVTKVVKQLPANTPPVVIVQHMPKGFTDMFAKRLDASCPMTVTEAKDRDRIQTGHVYIAPGDFHLKIKKDAEGYFLTTENTDKVNGHRPSVDVVFNSAVTSVGRNAVAVILTGMGKDGASGLLALSKVGAHTIGQDENTCVVYGMPMVAFNIGAVKKQAPIDDIAGLILKAIST